MKFFILLFTVSWIIAKAQTSTVYVRRNPISDTLQPRIIFVPKNIVDVKYYTGYSRSDSTVYVIPLIRKYVDSALYYSTKRNRPKVEYYLLKAKNVK